MMIKTFENSDDFGTYASGFGLFMVIIIEKSKKKNEDLYGLSQ